MEIKREYPPNYKQIAAAFPLSGKEIFTYGEYIYAPGKLIVTEELVEHELVHKEQQRLYLPAVWWKKYIEDKEFRLKQELPAHIAEYNKFKSMHKDRNVQVKYLNYVATRLSSAMYGKIVSKQQALKMMKNGS